MAKKESGTAVKKKRLWYTTDEETRKAVAILAIQADTTAEKLVGSLVADAVRRYGHDLDAVRKLLGRK